MVQGLPETFKPCARLENLGKTALLSNGETIDTVLSQFTWYSILMCSSTMLNYHMTRILLLINKPHESTARRCTVSQMLRSYQMIASEMRFHAHEILGIALSRPGDAVRIH